MAESEAEGAKKYLAEHRVEQAIVDAVSQLILNRPSDPIEAMGKLLQGASASALKMVTWNIAAVNNNPFEYWLTHPDPAYDKLMADVQNFIEEPGDADVLVGEVFSQAMFDELDALMTAQGWDAGESCRAAFAELSQRKIISGFLKDAELGNKRLMSMPDRMTNMIDLAGGGAAFRPTVISSYAGDMATVDKWWAVWKDFMFARKLDLPDKKGGATAKLPCALLSKIPRAKYPALSAEEEAMSVRLQTLCLALFDAILVHMLNTLSPDAKWLAMKLQILEALLVKKEDKIISILRGPYAASHILFLQEVRTVAGKQSLPSALPEYSVHAPAKPSKADQNSVICLRRATFDAGSVVDVTAKAMELLPAEGTKPADGDLLVLTANDKGGKPYLLASFHGDTDGLATATTLHAVHAFAATLPPSTTLLFGLDANTYAKAKPGKQAAVSDFLADVASKGYAATSGTTPMLTSYNARTYLQPQLQKACKINEKKSKGDCNPKDFILYSASACDVVECGVDTTTKRTWSDSVIPSLEWPSDHGLVYSTILPAASSPLPELS